jgi:eukaryotic-like serine/threonine-protein kinase
VRATIEAGSIISHYRILAPLGAGGMGEVYKAHDQTLERTVALKVLPAHLVRNEERVRRFVREAKAASSLNHPHIVTIHEIGEAMLSSADDGRPIQYIAMELIDGVTLKQKIDDADVGLRALLGYLVQVAEGLAKAHAANIVHRDLKPENIMVTRDGYAKVLDFGLAKLFAKKSVSDAELTVARDLTREGTIVGTVAYMSPEQVRGKPTDHRSDIFAFGSVLYEVCTRLRPFEADSDLDVMHRILNDKPRPIDELNPKVPAEVRRMVRRCMAKDADKRYHSMKDVALELSEIVEEFEQLSASQTSESVTGPIPVRPRRRGLRIAAAAAALALVAAIGFIWLRERRSPAAQIAFSSMKVRALTTTGNVMAAAISPDGKLIAHSTRDDEGKFTLWVRQISTGMDVPLVGPVGGGFGGAIFSPDGSWLYYSQREATEGASASWLYQIGALGGPSRKVLYDIDTPIGFSPDGKQFAFGRGMPKDNRNLVLVANADGSGERKVAELTRYESPLRPAWSPDGTKIVTGTGDLSHGYRIYLNEIDVATGAVRKIGGPWFAVGDLQFMPDGSSILMTAVDVESGRSQVWLQPYPEGEPVRLTNDANHYVSATTSDGSAISAVLQERNSDLRVASPEGVLDAKPYTRLSNHVPITLSASRSGAVVCTIRSGPGADSAIIDGPNAPLQFLTASGRSSDPAISADGRTVVFAEEHGHDTNVFAVDADGSRLRQVTRGNMDYAPRISADGRTIVYVRADNTLWTTTVDGKAPRRIADHTFGRVLDISADGTKVLYRQWTGNGAALVARLKVVPLAGGPPLLDLPANVGSLYHFHPDGETIGYVRSARGVANIWTMPLRGGEPVQVTKLEKGSIYGYDWLPDGRLVLACGETRNDLVLITDFRR